MTYPLRILIPLLYLIIFHSGCKNEDDQVQPESVVDELHGEWIWLQSQGGFGGWTYTPESEGIDKKLVIDNVFYKEYHDDSLALQLGYQLGTLEEPFGTDESDTFIQFDSVNIGMVVLIKNDTLELFEHCFDCFNHLYVRKK